jgi:hypothetical protein
MPIVKKVIIILLWLNYFCDLINLYHVHTYFLGGTVKKITRTEAATLGLNKYYTGIACRNGHVCERYTVNGACVDCNANHSIVQRQRIRRLMSTAKQAQGDVE